MNFFEFSEFFASQPIGSEFSEFFASQPVGSEFSEFFASQPVGSEFSEFSEFFRKFKIAAVNEARKFSFEFSEFYGIIFA